MTVYGKQFHEKIGSNVSVLKTWRDSTNFTWNDVGRLVGRCSNFHLLVVVVQICFRRAEVIWRPWCTGNDLCNFCTIAHDTREVAFQYQRIFWPNERYPRWRKNQVKCWGWVVQPCSWCYEHFWSPCHQGNDPCNFCGIQHATSEVTFQYQRIFGRSMDDTHVEQQRQFNMRVCEGVVKGWDQFLVWSFVLFY